MMHLVSTIKDYRSALGWLAERFIGNDAAGLFPAALVLAPVRNIIARHFSRLRKRRTWESIKSQVDPFAGEENQFDHRLNQETRLNKLQRRQRLSNSHAHSAAEKPTVFISYAEEDFNAAARLYLELKQAGIRPWMAPVDLTPGTLWRKEIEERIPNSDFFIVFLSKHSVRGRGFVHEEIRQALKVLDCCPEGEIFVIPVRLEPCEPSHKRLNELHRVDLFPEGKYADGLRSIVETITSRPISTATGCKGAVTDVYEIISDIMETYPEAMQATLLELPPLPPVQDCIQSKDEKRLIDAALELRERSGLGFWYAVLRTSTREDLDTIPQEILDAAIFHNKPLKKPVLRKDCTSQHLRRLARVGDSGRIVAISSEIALKNGSRRHMPMLVFGCSKSPKNLEIAEETIRRLGIGGGFLLESSRSYQFIGDCLLSEHELVDLLAKSARLSPIVDSVWATHQLQERACALQISPNDEGRLPRFLKRIDLVV